jgi:hypothetical protein
MNEEDKSIYDLKLHECLIIKRDYSMTYRIVRVPGGWIYKYVETDQHIFVPFDNEFQI